MVLDLANEPRPLRRWFKAVIGNVTVINQTGLASYLTLYPIGQAAPLAANMIYQSSQILSNVSS